MGLNIRPSTSVERKLTFLEALLNGTDKVSKVSDGSVLSGIADGIAKIAGKAEKDVILAVSQLFPDTAFQDQLDEVALNFGLASRFNNFGSSTYVRLTATPGTIYLANTHIPSSTDGITFPLTQDTTIGASGYAYAQVSSASTGLNTNVAPLTISKISPAPNGHINIVNEYMATGGLDNETDELFRIRIKDGANILARGTISMLEQLFISINPRVLRVFHDGVNEAGNVVLSIATVNGADLSPTELSNLLTQSAEYFALTEYKPFGTSFYGIVLRNVTYQYIDVAFRCQLANGADPDAVRQSIQVAMSKYVDYRYFDASTDSVQWLNLIEIVANTNGIEYVPDQYFYPRTDIGINTNALPRLRGFLMLALDGTVLENQSGTLQPIYYPNVVDASYMASILQNT